MKSFNVDKFRNPSNEFYPVYGWLWNDVVTKDGIKTQLDDMYEKGILGVYIIPLPAEFRPTSMVTNLQPPYLSDGYFEMLSYAVDYATAKGMKFWIYDEGGWPSGNANFLVTKDDPDLCLKVSFDPAINNTEKPGVLPNYSDLTNIKATEKFIQLTHQAHKEKMGESFKKLAPFVFTDEPSIRFEPFSETIREMFKKRTGEELSCEKISAHNDPEYNIAYHDVCAEAFAENYFKPIRKWCHENGMLHTGHLAGEDETLGYRNGFHQAMRLLRLLDIPGVDTIWGQIDPGTECLFFPRLASSAAEQNGSGLSVTESMGVYGSPTYEETRYVIGYQMVRGINIINPLLLSYDNSGYYTLRERPSYSLPQPGLEYLAEFNHYVARLTYFMQCGKPDTNCALYMPMCDFWADDKNTPVAAKNYEELGAAIERNHGQFDIADDDLILSCDPDALKNGEIRMGRACYTKLYIPADKYMPTAVREQLEIFKNGGGKVYYRDKAQYFPALEISGDKGKLRVHKRVCENCEIYLVFNEASEKVTAKLNLPENAYELSETGEKYKTSLTYDFECGEIKLFVVSACDDLKSHYEQGKEIVEITEFEMKPLRKFTLSEAGASYKPVSIEKTAVKCVDWIELLGEDFSGECEYRAKFTLENTDKDLVLSLGDVRYSCTAFLNGVSLGNAIMPPYKFLIEKKLLKKENELEIRVSNTASNAFVNFKIPAEWEPKHVGPYHEKAVNLEKNFLHGGLLGPIKLYKGK